jgi:hypothetical protein
VALALTDTVMLACTFVTAVTWDAIHEAAAVLRLPMLWNVIEVWPATSAMTSLRASVSLKACPMSPMRFANDA